MILFVFIVRKIIICSMSVLSCLTFLIIFVQIVIMTTKIMNAICELINKINKLNDRINYIITMTISFVNTNNHSHEIMNFNLVINVFDLYFYFFLSFKNFVFFMRIFVVVFLCIHNKRFCCHRATTIIARVINFKQRVKIDFIAEQLILKKFRKNSKKITITISI